MAKKGQAVQLQTEVNNDDDWNNLLQKPGLIVADVYSEWCGPCSGMVATLKKIKLEIGGDVLQLALAKAEGVTALSRFKGKSEPAWLLISKGKLANYMFGADAPRLSQLITDELKKEIDAMEGRRERDLADIEEPTPFEKRRDAKFEAEKKAEEERERQKIEEEIRVRRTKECSSILDNLSHFGVLLILPNATKRYQEIINDLLNEAGLNIFKTEKTYISDEKLEELFYFGENIFNEQTIEEVQNNESICLIVKPKQSQDLDIEDVLLKLVYGNSKAPPGDPNSPAMILARPTLPSKLLQPIMKVQPEKLGDDEDEEFGGEEEEEEEEDEEEEEMGGNDEVPKEPDMLMPDLLLQTKEDDEEEEGEEEEEPEKISLWTPPNPMVKGSALKIFATDIVSNYILPIPEPTPPHFAIVYDINRRFELFPLMDKYRKQVLNYGFFTDSVPEKAELIAKTVRQYERSPVKPAGAKMVIQLSRKKSECLLSFITLKPTYMSPNSDEGKRECKIFFPDTYKVKKDDEEEEEEEEMDLQGEETEYLEGDEEVAEEIIEEEEAEEEEIEEEDESEAEEGDVADFYEVVEGYVQIKKEILEELFYFADNKLSDPAIEEILKLPSFILLLKRSFDNQPSTIDDVICQMVYGNVRKPPGDDKTPYQQLLIIKETGEIPGLWTPLNSLTKAVCLKLFFPNISSPYLLPATPSTPLHIAVAYDVFKYRYVIELSAQYPGQVMKYGFFTSDVPGDAKLIAKTVDKFENRTDPPTYEEKFVIQLAKTRRDCVEAFLDLGPSYRSKDGVIGMDECKLFFPPNYDEPEENLAETKRKKRKSKAKVTTIRQLQTNENQENIAEYVCGVENEHGDLEERVVESELIVEGDGGGSDNEEDDEDGNGGSDDGEVVDKATSPMNCAKVDNKLEET